MLNQNQLHLKNLLPTKVKVFAMCPSSVISRVFETGLLALRLVLILPHHTSLPSWAFWFFKKKRFTYILLGLLHFEASNKLTNKMAAKWKASFLNFRVFLHYCAEILEQGTVMKSHWTEGMRIIPRSLLNNIGPEAKALSFSKILFSSSTKWQLG